MRLDLSLIVDDGLYEFKVDQTKRQIAGLVMPWGVVAVDSRGLGRWRFKRGSLNWSAVSRVKLLRDHDMHQPVGKAISLTDREDGLYGVFQVARGSEGDKVLSLAEDGVLDGFSAGTMIDADGWEMSQTDNGVRDVLNGRMAETTITALPAYDDARVQRVTASLYMGEKGAGESMGTESENKGGENGGGATVLEHEGSAFERFEQELDQRFEKLTDKIAETQERQSESVTKIITDAFGAAYKNLEGPQSGYRADMAAARLKVTREEPVYRFDGNVRAASMVRDFWRANTERDHDAVERLRKFQAQQRDMVDLLTKLPPNARALFAVTTGTAGDVIPPGYRPDLFVNELMQGRPLVAMASRGTITDATPFTVPRFVSATGATADHVEGTNPTPGSITLDSVTVTPGAVSGSFELTREIVDAANPAIDAIALAAMRESYNQQTEVKAYAALNGVAAGSGVENITTVELGQDDGLAGKRLRLLLAKYPFARFAAPTGASISQLVTTNFAGAEDTTGRPLYPSVGAQNTSGLGNAVSQGWFVDGLAHVPAWSVTETAGDDVGLVVNRTDYWAWESPLLTFRFEEKSGPALIEMALFAYYATQVLRPSGIFALRKTD